MTVIPLSAFADTIAVTTSGETVVLKENGRWEYQLDESKPEGTIEYELGSDTYLLTDCDKSGHYSSCLRNYSQARCAPRYCENIFGDRDEDEYENIAILEKERLQEGLRVDIKKRQDACEKIKGMNSTRGVQRELARFLEVTVDGVWGPETRQAIVKLCSPQIAKKTGRWLQSKGKIFIKSLRTDGPNSAGGVDVRVKILNRSSKKTIKYVRLRLTPYNAVGDVIESRIGDHTTRWGRATGPYKPGEEAEVLWENVWYNSTLDCVEIDGIEIQYMNGMTVNIPDKEVGKLLTVYMSNDCSYKGG